MALAATGLAHEQVRALFAPLVDHELGASDEVVLRSHLEGCAECRRSFDQYSHAVALVRSVGRERAPADFANLVMRRVRRRRRALFGGQGGRLFDVLSIPSAEVAIPILIAAVIAAVLIFSSP